MNGRSSAPDWKITSWASCSACQWAAMCATPTTPTRTRIPPTIYCCYSRRRGAIMSWACRAPMTSCSITNPPAITTLQACGHCSVCGRRRSLPHGWRFAGSSGTADSPPPTVRANDCSHVLLPPWRDEPMNNPPLVPSDPIAAIEALKQRTPSRVLAGRAGTAYRTATQLTLRRVHAFARDAVSAELDFVPDLGQLLIDDYRLFITKTQAAAKDEHLRRPDLGRRFSPESREQVIECCPPARDLQIVTGDGLSARADAPQEPPCLPRAPPGATERGWRLGRPFAR